MKSKSELESRIAQIRREIDAIYRTTSNTQDNQSITKLIIERETLSSELNKISKPQGIATKDWVEQMRNSMRY